MTWPAPVPTLSSGETTTLSTKFNQLRDALNVLGDPWTAYTPTWTGSVADPVKHNGTIVGAYMRTDSLVIGRITITMGSTTTYGTGGWSLSLPVAPVSGSGRPLMVGTATDTGTGDYPLFGVIVGSTLLLRTLPTTAGNPLTAVTSAVPHTWANTDVLTINYTYEAA